jgi:myo-inositol-1(or 4)-monophosphatase
MTETDHENLVLRVAEIAVEAGRSLCERLRADQQVEISTKSSIGDLVTELDVQIQNDVSLALTRLLPGSEVVGEEGGGPASSAMRWVVDPIDGSTNVVHGLPHAAICVALCSELEPVLGVVHDPFAGITYAAVAGRGATVDDGRGQGRRELRVSANSALEQSLISFGLPYDRAKTGEILAAVEQVFLSSQDLRRRGSASLDLVAIAGGQTEGHFELDLRIWDVAAAGLILVEAGGVLTDWSGEPARWNDPTQKINVAASNGRIHRELLSTLRRSRSGRASAG